MRPEQEFSRDISARTARCDLRAECAGRAHRHGRLFSLLRADGSLMTEGAEDMHHPAPRAPVELTDAELLSIRVAASRTLYPRSI